jgi:transposase
VSAYHVVRIPLRASARDLRIVRENLVMIGKLRNATLGDLLNRIDRMRADPAWADAGGMPRSKEKTLAYRELYKQYDVSQVACANAAHAHWRASGWMNDRIAGRQAIALAPELWQNLQEYVYARAERPRFKPSAERNVVWNSDNTSGLLLRDGRVEWACKTKRKRLSIPLDPKSMSRTRRTWLEQALAEGRLRRVGIKRELVRGEERLFALVCLEGVPYRNKEYLALVEDTDDVVGLDLGPTMLALVSGTEAIEMPIMSPERLRDEERVRKLERRRKRAADRSRQAANPHARRKNGRSIKGVQQPQRSTRGIKREHLLADIKRKDRINRKRHQQELVRRVMHHGTRLGIEDLDYRAWQKSLYGRRMGVTSPGQFTDLLTREAVLLGGSVTRVDPWQARASQTCLCGTWTGKKQLSERAHVCPSCGLVASRDLVAAAVIRELVLANEPVWDEGLALASGTKHQTMRLLASSRRTPSSPNPTPGRRGEKQDTLKASSDAIGTVLSCVNGVSDPVENTPALAASSRAPMREHPLRMGTSRNGDTRCEKTPPRAEPTRTLG